MLAHLLPLIVSKEQAEQKGTSHSSLLFTRQKEPENEKFDIHADGLSTAPPRNPNWKHQPAWVS